MDLQLPQLAPILLGIVLLLFGRRLYWLALGGLGALVGLHLAQHFLELDSALLELALSLLAGILGALLAVMAQKIAIAVAGVILGGFGTLWLLEAFAVDPGNWLWLALLAGAIVGVLFASLVFEVSLTLLSSFVGATLIADNLPLAESHRAIVLLVLAAVGIFLQSRGPRRRRLPRR